MRTEMLVIGDEVLDGRIVDSNSQRFALALDQVGVLVQQRTVITDDIDIIVREARAIAARGTKLCIVSGGLGPTSDDLTAEAFAKLAGVSMLRDAEQAKRIEAHLAARGRGMTENQLKQADRPTGAEVIANPVGTAPGFAIVFEGCRFVSLPGVPKEFDRLLEDAVIAPMRAKQTPRARRGLYCYNIVEAEADKRLAQLPTLFADVRLQFRVKFPEVHVTMHCEAQHEAQLEEAYAYAQQQLGDVVFAHKEGPFAKAVLDLLHARNESVAMAESCTGGLMCDMLTDVPGSSAHVHIGVTAYANAAKQALLGVEEAVLSQYGAVSEQAVRQMAQGVRKLCGSTYGIAVSGIAGPGGGTAHKPVGTIWFGLAWPGGVEASTVVLPFARRENKIVGAYRGLDLLRRHMLAQP